MGDAALLLVPAANVSVPGVEESHAVTASIVSKAVADLATASATVSNMAHANAKAMCTADSALPTCAVMTILNSEIADVTGAGSLVYR